MKLMILSKPNERLRRYVWEYMGSLLLGTNQNQTFNVLQVLVVTVNQYWLNYYQWF